MNRANKQADGVFYTPDKLADYLLAGCPNMEAGNVLDPACGGLALIRAAQRRFCGCKKIHYYGCDKRAIGSDSKDVALSCSDFFSYSPCKDFNLIVTNPPYIRGCKCPSSCREWFEQHANELPVVSARSDLWVYFILKCTYMLSSGGSMAAILPWSFFQSEYSIPVREYLSEKFGQIRCLIITQEQFSDTAQKIVLLWLDNKAASQHTFKCGVVNKLTNKSAHYRPVVKQDWISMQWLRNNESGAFLRDRFRSLSDFCDVKIGIVPGATEFFVRSREDIRSLGVDIAQCPKVLTSSRQLNSLNASLYKGSINHLLCLTSDDATREGCRKLIMDGEAHKLNERRHCQNRSQWYVLKKPGRIPDGFFSYRSATIPMLMLNDCGFVNTNGIHSIYFNDGLTDCQKRWIQISLLSAFSLIDIELKARTYGKNVLKIEPTALKGVRVYCNDSKISKKDLDALTVRLNLRDMDGVVMTATGIIGRTLQMNESQIRSVIKRYAAIRKRRTGFDFLSKKEIGHDR